MRSPDVQKQLVPQDGLYAVSVHEGRTVRDRVIGAVLDVQNAADAAGGVANAIAAPETRIVSLTVTEKGYRLDPAGGVLNLDDPDVRADLGNLSRPRTAAGLIVAGLGMRRARNLPPLTVLSCDNLARNGARLRASVLAIARAHDDRLADWIEAAVAFPESMVDRIVPATTESDIAALAERSGVIDRGLVRTEPFFQWVVEDRFAGERPDLERFGVQMTGAVAPWEEAKLRLLNGAHSLIAYLGALAGLEHVHDVVAMRGGASLVEALWDESAATLSPPPGLDLDDYRRRLMARFRNSALRHRTRQIAMDGSQKLPPRLLAPIAHRLEQGRSVDTLALGVAAWIRWAGGRDDANRGERLDDPLADPIRRALGGAGDSESQVDAALTLRAIFPPGLAVNPVFRSALATQLSRLESFGAAALLRG